MRFKPFEQVALARDIPDKKLRRGDLATIVDVHPENGAVTVVPESLLESLNADEILHVRSLAR